MAMASGWHSANFSRAKHLRGLDHYLRQMLAADDDPAEEAAAAFATLAERGLVTIREIKRTG